jgi:hypothetical protein
VEHPDRNARRITSRTAKVRLLRLATGLSCESRRSACSFLAEFQIVASAWLDRTALMVVMSCPCVGGRKRRRGPEPVDLVRQIVEVDHEKTRFDELGHPCRLDINL